MLKAILFDLDDTLLGNSMETFVPAYFQALTRYMAHLIPADRLIPELLRCTQAMETNDGTGPTNEETFAANFYPALGFEREDLEPVFQRFYAEEFHKLRGLTHRLPTARPLVEWALERGLQVAIATNPLFPRSPIEQRLDWAGVPVAEFNYALVTSYENMHATKAHPAYYREILDRLGCRPDKCLMVGDDWKRDITPASLVGIPTYWIVDQTDELPADSPPPAGQGTLAHLWEWVKNQELSP